MRPHALLTRLGFFAASGLRETFLESCLVVLLLRPIEFLRVQGKSALIGDFIRLTGKIVLGGCGIRFERHEYHAAQSGRFVARPRLGPEQLPGTFWTPSRPDPGLELSLAKKLDWGDFLAEWPRFYF